MDPASALRQSLEDRFGGRRLQPDQVCGVCRRRIERPLHQRQCARDGAFAGAPQVHHRAVGARLAGWSRSGPLARVGGGGGSLVAPLAECGRYRNHGRTHVPRLRVREDCDRGVSRGCAGTLGGGGHMAVAQHQTGHILCQCRRPVRHPRRAAIAPIQGRSDRRDLARRAGCVFLSHGSSAGTVSGR